MVGVCRQLPNLRHITKCVWELGAKFALTLYQKRHQITPSRKISYNLGTSKGGSLRRRHKEDRHGCHRLPVVTSITATPPACYPRGPPPYPIPFLSTYRRTRLISCYRNLDDCVRYSCGLLLTRFWKDQGNSIPPRDDLEAGMELSCKILRRGKGDIAVRFIVVGDGVEDISFSS